MGYKGKDHGPAAPLNYEGQQHQQLQQQYHQQLQQQYHPHYQDGAGQNLLQQPSSSANDQNGGNQNSGSNVGKATSKAGAYGGSELGSMLGGAVGPPIIGNIIGNLVGEKVGEKAIRETGMDEAMGKAGDKLSGVIGRERVEKIPEITLTALGYSENEECVCCPCLTASQVLLFIAIPFFFFNFYKLGIGISYESGCLLEGYVYNSTDNVTEIYPCEFGYHYMVVSSAVWLAILPFWICGLFGNCWRQCCCCCCDPIVLCATASDFLQKCCCECGNFKVCEILWLAHCSFHIIWSFLALSWWIGLESNTSLIHDRNEVNDWEIPRSFIDTVIASIFLDFILAGSELFHRIRVKQRQMCGNTDQVENVEVSTMNPDIQIHSTQPASTQMTYK